MESLVDYSRQAEMENDTRRDIKSTNIQHVVVGCGGIGFWIGLYLAMYGAERIMLVDGDKLERSNLARIPTPVTWVGINKAIALRKIISYLRPECKVVVRTKYVTEDSVHLLEAPAHAVYAGRKHMWDCTDNAVIQRLLSKYTDEQNGWTYLKVGYEGYDVGMFPELRSMWGVENAEVGYQTTRANVLSSAIAGGLAVLGKMFDVQNDRTFNLRKLVEEGVRNE